jgi:solute carrier family 35, member C2
MDPKPHQQRRGSPSLDNSITPKPLTHESGQQPSPPTSFPGGFIDTSTTLDNDRDTESAAGSSDFELDDMLSDEGLEDDEETGLTGTERGKRRRRKRKNAQLDQRVVGGISYTEEEDKLAAQTVIRASLINASLIALW